MHLVLLYVIDILFQGVIHPLGHKEGIRHDLSELRQRVESKQGVLPTMWLLGEYRQAKPDRASESVAKRYCSSQRC